MRAKYLSSGGPRDPAEISDVLGSIIEKASVGIDVRHGDLIERWESLVPPDWASVAKPIGVKEGTLLVEVENGTAGSLLKYQIGDLVRAISAEFGSDLVTDVRLKVSRS